MKKTIFDKIDELVVNREAYLEELKSNKAEAEAELKEARSDVDKVLKEKSGAEEYANAKMRVVNAESKTEYYTKTIKEINAMPLIDEHERVTYLNDLNRVIEKAKSEELKTMIDCLQKSKDILKVYDDKLRKVNTYIKKVDTHNHDITDTIMNVKGTENMINNAIHGVEWLCKNK